jgi:hypothetical protein
MKSEATVSKPQKVNESLPCRAAAERLHARLFHFCPKVGPIAVLAGIGVPKDE